MVISPDGINRPSRAVGRAVGEKGRKVRETLVGRRVKSLVRVEDSLDEVVYLKIFFLTVFVYCGRTHFKGPLPVVDRYEKKRTFFFHLRSPTSENIFQWDFFKVILLVEIRSFLGFSKPADKILGY